MHSTYSILKNILILSNAFIFPINQWSYRLSKSIIVSKTCNFIKLNLNILIFYQKCMLNYLISFFKKGNHLLIYLSEISKITSIYRCVLIYLFNKTSISFFYDSYIEGSVNNYNSIYLHLIKELFNRFKIQNKSTNKIILLLRLLFITIHNDSTIIDLRKFQKIINYYYWRIFIYYYCYKHLLCIPQSFCLLTTGSIYVSGYSDFHSLNLPIIGNIQNKLHYSITYPLFGNNSLLFIMLIANIIKNIWLINIKNIYINLI
jgi:hypothetical protein